MQTENRKLPKKDSRKSSLRSRALSTGSSGALRVQLAIATAAMPKRIQASKNTGNTATSSLDKPT